MGVLPVGYTTYPEEGADTLLVRIPYARREIDTQQSCERTTVDRVLAHKVMAALVLVTERSVLAVDLSDFGNGLQVPVFARQTRSRRALPVYFEVLRCPIEKDSQNLHTCGN